MKRFRAGQFTGRKNRLDVQIALIGSSRTDADRFIGDLSMKRIPVRFGKDSDRPDSKFPAGADDPNRDLAAVCDQDFLKHSL